MDSRKKLDETVTTYINNRGADYRAQSVKFPASRRVGKSNGELTHVIGYRVALYVM